MSSVKCAGCGMINWSTALTCKRCGASMNVSAGPAVPRAAGSKRTYPPAHHPRDAKQGEIIKPCVHCGKEVALKRWDSWNGFLVECPHCGGLHGKRWKTRQVLTASFLFSALSFLFTMRPRQALLSVTVFIVLAGLATIFVLNSEVVPDLLEVAVVSGFILGPMIVNGIVLMIHERDLDDSAPPTQALRQ